ncbi:MAG: tetratricopeptide repeat protein [Anaerolineales bacterium]|nr:tetratricopeptide repeat protein [Anaerolineales bacterium]
MTITKDGIQQLIESDELIKAEEQSRLLVNEYPDDAGAKVVLGRVLAMQGKYEEAIAPFQEALQQDSQNFEASFFLAIAHEDLEQYDEALKAYREALATGEYSSLIHYRMGRLYADHRYEKRSNEQARMHLRWATEGERPIEEAFLELARIEPPKRAVYVLQNGLRLFPKSHKLHERLASRHFQLEDFASCIETVESASEMGVDTENLRFLSAKAHFRVGRFDKAREVLAQISIGDDEKQRHALECFKSAVLIEEGKHDEAMKTLQSLIVEDFTNRLDFAAHFLLMCAYLRQGHVEEAESVFKEIPDSKEYWDMSVYADPVAYTLRQYLAEALDGLVSNSTDEATVAKARGTRAVERFQRIRERQEEAFWQALKEELSYALRISPNNAEYNRHLGYVLEELHDWVGATRHYILAQLNADKELYLQLDTLDKIYRSKTRFKKLVGEVDKILASRRHFWRERFARSFLGELIQFLHSKAEFEKVIHFGQQFEYSTLLEAEVLFEMAYAYVSNSR